MRIFLAGGSGVLGMRLVPVLLGLGHEVAAMTRSPDKLAAIDALGASPVVCDAFDRTALCDAVAAFRASVVVNQLTDLPDHPSAIAHHAAGHARIRTEGTDNVIAAASACGARVVMQSVAWDVAGPVGDAVRYLEENAGRVGGVILRYGQWYGPGTYWANPPAPPRIHIDEAAERTAELIDAPPGIYTVTDGAGG